MRGLYAIVDTTALSTRAIEPLGFARAILAARPAALQLRAKDLPPRDTLGLLRALGPLCHAQGVPLVANDRPDLAMLAGCDFVHVGQTDMPVDRVRRIAPGLGVGVSTHTLPQLDEALEMRPDYVAFGPVFPTASKAGADPVVGLARTKEASLRARAAGIPVFAIGGISRSRAKSLVEVVDGVAVIAELLPSRSSREGLDEVTSRARELQALFEAPGSEVHLYTRARHT